MRRLNQPSEGDIAYAKGTVPEHISENRMAFLRAASFDPDALTLGRQVHGSVVSVANPEDRGRGQPPEFDAIPDSDGLVTSTPDVALGTIVADCVPILLYDPHKHALGLLHAGWRGTVQSIASVGVKRMIDAFGSRPQDLVAGIGPSIGPCCYEVGDDVIDAWSHAGPDGWQRSVVEKNPKSHLDLWTANHSLLQQAGLRPDKIEVAAQCTRCCEGSYFSHRAAMAGERARGRMIMVAQLTD